MGQKQPKKLTLNRETVRDLTTDDLASIQGGSPTNRGPQCVDTNPNTTDPSLPLPCYVCQVTCGICKY